MEGKIKRASLIWKGNMILLPFAPSTKCPVPTILHLVVDINLVSALQREGTSLFPLLSLFSLPLLSLYRVCSWENKTRDLQLMARADYLPASAPSTLISFLPSFAGNNIEWQRNTVDTGYLSIVGELIGCMSIYHQTAIQSMIQFFGFVHMQSQPAYAVIASSRGYWLKSWQPLIHLQNGGSWTIADHDDEHTSSSRQIIISMVLIVRCRLQVADGRLSGNTHEE